MTKSQGEASASWLVIEWDLDALKQIEERVTEEWAQDREQPLETGGLLLGTYLHGRICIAAFEAISFAAPGAAAVPRGARVRPMTPRETAEAAFAERVRFHETRPERGRNVVGWYRSQAQGPPELEAEDSRLHAKYFPEPWQVALILAPTGNGGADAGFFFLGNRGLASGPAFDGTPFAIDLDTLRQVENDVVQGFQDQEQWGMEVGGLLLGDREEGRLHARGVEPIKCQHASGAGFILTDEEQASMARSKARWDEEGLESGGARVIGWYQSHVRGGLELAGDAMAFHEKYFEEPWHIAMVLRPYANGSADAAFFFRRTLAETSSRPGTAARVPLKAAPAKEARYWKSTDLKISAEPEPEPAAAAPDIPPGLGVEVPVIAAVAVSAEAVAEKAMPVRPDARPLTAPRPGNAPAISEQALEPEPIHSEVSSEWLKQIQREYEQVEDKPPKRSQGAVWAVLAGLVVVSLGVVLYLRSQFAPQPVPVRTTAIIPVAAVFIDGHIELHWDPKALGAVKKGVLGIRDAGTPIEMPLDAATLASGSYAFLAKSDVTAFQLHVDKLDGSSAEGATTYVAPSIPVDRAVETGASGETPAPVDAGTDTVREVARDQIRDEPKDDPSGKKNSQNPPATRSSEKQADEKRLEARKSVEKKFSEKKNDDAARQAPAKSFVPPVQSSSRPPVSTIEAPELNGIQAQQVQRGGAVPGLAVAAGVAPSAPPVSKPAASPVAVTKQPVALNGRWAMQPGSFSRSPALPSAIDISVREDGGSVHGTLDARYKSGSKSERMSLSFSGKMVNGVARFPWSAKDGRHGEIEFVQVPNSPNSVEVVWYSSDSKQVFNEIVRKSQ